jgi:hypothetical protein
MGEKWPVKFSQEIRLPHNYWVLLLATKLRHGTDGFTSPPKEGMLWIFFALKIRRVRPGFNPRTWVPEASMLTTRPPKPLGFTILRNTDSATWQYPQLGLRQVCLEW